ncbi:Fe2+-dependent dioxygenase [Erythrobacter sp. JK5]|uniref:Fe2+-dependent dioxygenase n=1 Tax=Erythrobacter sp. JK5 TaxID=2829500 RepID=UPI001BABFC43|nr:Fe2+-dependent dioxygenase [Erythrobacter sp. JK5]QUL36677.1 Fe2+-dependent dioxygenase [Erythrobacter sp. JK5]
MILTISAIEDEDQLAGLRRRVDALEWRDGRATAGKVAGAVKHNRQAVMTGPVGQEIEQRVLKLVAANPVVKAAARPRRFTRLIVSRTADGGHYGAHVDNAIMGSDKAALRTDLAFTLFLSAPDEYEGGELVVHSAGMTSRIKGKAGQLVLYPATSIHEVCAVTEGERIACVGWIESLVPDQAQRELLFDLENLRVALRQQLEPNSVELLTLDKNIANLLRMWART